jgi:hypothetical protein
VSLFILFSDINDYNMNEPVANPSTRITPTDDRHSSACSSSTTASDSTVAANCVTCQTLKSNIDRLQKQLALKNRLISELRRKHKASLRKIRKVTTEKVAFGGAVNKFLNNDQQKYLSKATRKGCKWSSPTVKNALQLHFACGPTGYGALLSQKYPLPSLRTLRRSIQFVKFHSGILTEVFTFLAIKVKAMNLHERECCLTLDEMSITAGVDFDNRTGHFIGDVTLPSHTGVATHSLVFMLGGISTRWKQTIAYYFTSNSTDGKVFAPIVLDIVNRCDEIGLNVAAITSDMGSANRAMWTKLGIVSGKKAVTVNSFLHPCNPGKNICVLADVPHIIKNVRNHLVNGQIFVLPPCIVQKFNLPCDTVSIEPLKKLVEYQKDKDLKPAPNLTAKHIDPSHFDKMKVSQAMNIFSHSVSAALRLMIETQSWDRNMLTTCWFLELMNKWFDLMSSRHPILAISRFIEDKYDSTISFLSSVIDIFDSMTISKPGAAASWKPVQSGVILSTMSVLQLQDRLLNREDFKFVLTARLSQDCLENLFSCVRSKNPVPTALEFKNCLRLLTVSQYLKGAETGSYDLADGSMVSDFLTLQPETKCDDVSDEVFARCKPLLDHGNLRVVELDSTELCCLYYLAGYALSRVEKNDVTCPACITSVKTKDFVLELGTEITSLLTLKEYRPGSLTPCNHAAFNVLLGAEIVFRQCEQSFLSASNDVRDQLMSEILDKTVDIVLPECHAIKCKLIRRFIGARLQFFAKKHRASRKEKVSKKSCHEMSSKSMQMRKSVSKIK